MAKRSISTEPFLWALFGATCWPCCATRSPASSCSPSACSPCYWAHRFRYSLCDGLQLKGYSELIGLLCYGGAVVGSAVAAGFLLGPIPK